MHEDWRMARKEVAADTASVRWDLWGLEMLPFPKQSSTRPLVNSCLATIT